MIIRGTTWVFGDNINTDLMSPNVSMAAPPRDRKRYVFQANRPGWSDQVNEGDIVVAGRNFGTGSGRAASKYVRELGVAAVIAESMNGLFFRNSVNYALPVMECPGIVGATREGDILEIDFESGTVVNVATEHRLQGTPLPSFLLEIIAAGGLLERLIERGMVQPPAVT